MFENISDQLKARAQKIKLIGFDVDGVLTDSSIFIDEKGEVFKKYCSLDGHGLKLCLKFGLKLCIISARKSAAVYKRFEGWGFDEDIHTGIQDKWTKMQEIMKKYDLTAEEVAFIGDDMPDVPILEKIGLAATPLNRHYSVDRHIHYITEKEGGKGAARELCDLILTAQGRIPNI
jgi:3-deoxy-D-manno-octulosonate 8-phosphate phosphatase (KDO 8-P phosphatase)